MDYVWAKCENGQLIITPDVNKAWEQEDCRIDGSAGDSEDRSV